MQNQVMLTNEAQRNVVYVDRNDFQKTRASKPSDDTLAIILIVVIVPPADSIPTFPVISAPSDARILNTMKKLNPHAANNNGLFIFNFPFLKRSLSTEIQIPLKLGI